MGRYPNLRRRFSRSSERVAVFKNWRLIGSIFKVVSISFCGVGIAGVSEAAVIEGGNLVIPTDGTGGLIIGDPNGVIAAIILGFKPGLPVGGFKLIEVDGRLRELNLGGAAPKEGNLIGLLLGEAANPGIFSSDIVNYSNGRMDLLPRFLIKFLILIYKSIF